MLKCQEVPGVVEKQIIEMQIVEKAQQMMAVVIRRKVADMVKDEAQKKRHDETLAKLQAEMDALETILKEVELKIKGE